MGRKNREFLVLIGLGLLIFWGLENPGWAPTSDNQGLKATVKEIGVTLEKPLDEGISCPKSLKDWKELRDWQTEVLLEGVGYGRGYGRLNACLEKLARNPSPMNQRIGTCLSNLNLYSQSLGEGESPGKVDTKTLTRLGLGFGPAYSEYHSQPEVVKATALPEEVKSAKLLLALKEATFSSLGGVKAIVDEINTTRRNAGLENIIMAPNLAKQESIDGTGQNRIALFVPGRAFNQFVQITLNDPKQTDVQARGLSVISVERKDPPRKAYFRDYWRTYADNKVQIGLHPEAPLGDCVGCHLNGPNEIHPPGVSKLAEEFKTSIQTFNEKIASNRAGQTGNLSVNQLPTLGPADSPFRTEEFLKRCSKFSTDSLVDVEKRKRLRGLMNCATCHNGVTLGRLGPNQMTAAFYSIRTGRMPPGLSRLKEEDREALGGATSQCLSDEYFGTRDGKTPGILKSWLFKSDCLAFEDDSTSTSTSNGEAISDLKGKPHPNGDILPIVPVPVPDPGAAPVAVPAGIHALPAH